MYLFSCLVTCDSMDVARGGSLTRISTEGTWLFEAAKFDRFMTCQTFPHRSPLPLYDKILAIPLKRH